jgi:hypothetical protein
MKACVVRVASLQLLGVLSRPMSVAAYLPTLRISITCVIGCRSDEEMIGVDARWSVAFVADLKPWRNRASGLLPRDTMSPAGFTYGRIKDRAVPCGELTKLPEPTAGVGLWERMAKQIIDDEPHRTILALHKETTREM